MIKNQLKSKVYKNHADFSKKFLIFGISLLIVFFEIALAKWSLFWGSSNVKPLLYIHTFIGMSSINVSDNNNFTSHYFLS